MSRRTRHDIPFTNREKRPKQMSVAEYKNRVFHEVKKRLLADGLIVPDPPKFEFHWQAGDKGGIVPANDRTFARHLIKKELGVEKLPPGTKIVKVIPSADSRARVGACQIGAAG